MNISYQTAFAASRVRLPLSCQPLLQRPSVRWQSTASALGLSGGVEPTDRSLAPATTPPVSPLSSLTTWHLMRNIILSSVLTKPLLMKPALAAVQKIANSKTALLNPDRNPVIRAVLKPLLYDHFCAGTNKTEISYTIDQVRKLGFAGVILCYGKEIQLSKDNQTIGSQGAREAQLLAWRDGTLETLDMVDAGNWLGIKFTGAGEDATEALIKGDKWSSTFEEAIYAICDKAKARNCRIWIDSEQQAVQKGIDRWTVDLMRKYNRDGDVLIYNTVQAYLKESRQKLRKQLSISSEEGWTLAIKLVRGAYIAVDPRHLIHDTKAETDASYNGILKDLMSGDFEGISKDKFPSMRLFLAGHNSESVKQALELGHRLAASAKLKVNPEFGQLQGMADDVGCDIIHFRQTIAEPSAEIQAKAVPTDPFLPQVYKCLTWGTIQECIQYLVRRAIENSAAVDRMRATATASKRELFRRITPNAFQKSQTT